MFAIPLPARHTCGDCLERRTPLKKKIAWLEAQVTELQANGTRLELERRAWKARAEALHELLGLLAIELPVAILMGPAHEEVRAALRSSDEILDRLGRLTLPSE